MKSIGEVLKTMRTLENGAAPVFSLSYIAYNKKKGKGGEIKSFDQAILCQDSRDQFTSKQKPSASTGTNESGSGSVRKNPEHLKNHTINIQIVNNGVLTSMIRKVHIPLITYFNGEKITL